MPNYVAMPPMLCGMLRRSERTPPAVDPEKEAHIIWALASSLGTEVAFGELSAEEAQTMMHYYLDRILGGFADTP